MLNLAVDHAISHHKKETEIAKFEELMLKESWILKIGNPTALYWFEV